MNSDIWNVSLWSRNYGLKINKIKAQPIPLGYSRLFNEIDFDNPPRLQLDSDILDYRNKVKDLLLLVDSLLTCNRVFPGVHYLKKKKSARFLAAARLRLLLIKSLWHWPTDGSGHRTIANVLLMTQINSCYPFLNLMNNAHIVFVDSII